MLVSKSMNKESQLWAYKRGIGSDTSVLSSCPRTKKNCVATKHCAKSTKCPSTRHKETKPDKMIDTVSLTGWKCRLPQRLGSENGRKAWESLQTRTRKLEVFIPLLSSVKGGPALGVPVQKIHPLGRHKSNRGFADKTPRCAT